MLGHDSDFDALRVAAGFCAHPVLFTVPIVVLFGFAETKRFGIRPLHDAFTFGKPIARAWSGFFAGLVLVATYAVASMLGTLNTDPSELERILSANDFLDLMVPAVEIIGGLTALSIICSFLPKRAQQAFGFVMLAAVILAGGTVLKQHVILATGLVLLGFFFGTIVAQIMGKRWAQLIGFLILLMLAGVVATFVNNATEHALILELRKNPILNTIWNYLTTTTKESPRKPPEGDFFMAVGLAALLLPFSVLYTLTYRCRRVLGCDWLTPSAASSVCLLLANGMLAYGILAMHNDSLPMVVIAIPVLAWIWSGFEKVKYPFQLIGTEPTKAPSTNPAPVPSGQNTTHPSVPKIVLRAGNLQEFFAKPPKRIVVVSTTGGGISAAAWTIAVLNRLTAENPSFKDELRVITGASGGMVGAAFYTMGRRGGVSPGKCYDWILQDHLSPVIRRLAFHDVFWDLLPIPNDFDRGRALEDSFSNAWGEKVGATALTDLAAEEATGALPSLIFTPMIVEDGRRLLISNLDLSGCASTTGAALLPNGNSAPTISGVELRELAPTTFPKLRLTTAARMNASFPYVSPAGILTVDAKEGKHSRLRIVDAGFYDNFGVNIATRWLLKHREYFLHHRTEIAYVQIRLTPLHLASENFPTDRSNPLVRGLEWLTSPLEAFWRALFQSMHYRNNENVETLRTAFGTLFSTAVLECPQIMPLNWSLTDEDGEAFENWAYIGFEEELARIKIRRKLGPDAPISAEDIRKGAEALRAWHAAEKAKSTDADENVGANAEFLRTQFAALKHVLGRAAGVPG